MRKRQRRQRKIRELKIKLAAATDSRQRAHIIELIRRRTVSPKYDLKFD
jgi:hypothetical protein